VQHSYKQSVSHKMRALCVKLKVSTAYLSQLGAVLTILH